MSRGTLAGPFEAAATEELLSSCRKRVLIQPTPTDSTTTLSACFGLVRSLGRSPAASALPIDERRCRRRGAVGCYLGVCRGAGGLGVRWASGVAVLVLLWRAPFFGALLGFIAIFLRRLVHDEVVGLFVAMHKP